LPSWSFGLNSRSNIKVIAGLLLAAFIVPYVMASIPPANYLLDKVANKRRQMGVKRLKVTMQCQAPEAEDAEEVENVIYFRTPGKVRRERGEQRVEVCINGRCQAKDKDAKVTQLPAWTYLQYLYFAEGEAKGSRYFGLLESLNVDTNVDTVSRFHKRIAFVIGAKHWEQDRPQFWLDKDLFLPLRIMARDGQSLIDIKWYDWGTKAGGDWFPAVLETRKDGQLLERCEISEVKSGVSMPNDMFKL
jgi:hypothetical protein